MVNSKNQNIKLFFEILGKSQIKYEISIETLNFSLNK